MDLTDSSPRRRRILDAALAVFVANGYVGTSTDQLAAAASISKATLYKEFGDKEGVFSALIADAAERIDDPFDPLIGRMGEVADATDGIALLAEQFARSIMAPSVQQLRRLVIAEATRFPHLGTLYWERGFVRVLDSVSACLQVLDSRRLLDVPEPDLAAQHFAGMLLWIPSNRTMFTAGAEPLADRFLARVIDSGTTAFLRAYSPSSSSIG